MAEIGQGHANFLARSTNIAEYSTNVRNLQGGMPILLYPTMTHLGLSLKTVVSGMFRPEIELDHILSFC